MRIIGLLAIWSWCSVGAASVVDDVRRCVVALEKSGTLDAEQIELVIGADFADGPLPAELSRTFRVKDQTYVKVEYRRDAQSRQLSIRREGLPDGLFSLFVYQIRADLKTRGIAAKLEPQTADPHNLMRGPVTSYQVFTGRRHTLTADEAARLFAEIDSIMVARIPGFEAIDAIQLGVMPNLNRTF